MEAKEVLALIELIIEEHKLILHEFQALEKVANDAGAIIGLEKAKEDFITLARAFSQDSMTVSSGGLINRYFNFGEMFDTPEFEEAAFGIRKLGGLSDVVQTNFGFHIIKLIDRKPTKEKVTLSDVSMQINQYLTTMKQKNVMDTWIDSLRTHAEIETHYELIK